MKDLEDALVGNKIVKLGVSEDQATLLVQTLAQGEYTRSYAIETYADCCSETWFADITGFDALIDSPVLGIEEPDDWRVEDDRTRQDRDIAYGIKIRTEKGICDIVYRNSSSGYYSGAREKIKELEYNPFAVEEIKDDWQA